MRAYRLTVIGICILYSVLCTLVHASVVECVGTATQVVQGTDTIFIFKDEIHLRSTVGDVDWYKADGTLYASGADEIYPDDGCYRVGNTHFCVYLYKSIDDLAFTVETFCDKTFLHVTGLPSASAYTRTCSLSYDTLGWNTEAWVDVEAVQNEDLKNRIQLPPLYGPTTISLCYDATVRQALGLDSACIEVELPLDSIKAVKHMMTSLATTRDAKNEKNRPTSQDIIKATTATDYSGPLEVAFYSNPTPGARFYRWDIYHSTDHIVTRLDQDIRYIFSEPGSYRVVCSVTNGQCTSDSTEMLVAISESYLKVPNVFTPNGDGQNDEFRVAFRSLREFHIWVYNRWGKLVYESTDPAKGWDGNINGRPAAEGAYYYVVRALGTDADKNAEYMSKIAYTKKKLKADEAVIGVYQLSGDINLLRGGK